MKRTAAVLSVCLLAVALVGCDENQPPLQYWRPRAEQGSAEAQFNLGWMYESGQGVTQDYVEALKWYNRSASQGYAVAEFNLGWMYGKGQGVTQDYAEALKWFRKASNHGYIKADEATAWVYENSPEARRDRDEAIKQAALDKISDDHRKAALRTLYTWTWVTTDSSEIIPSDVAGAWTLKCNRLGREAGAKTVEVSIEVNSRVFGRPDFDPAMEDRGIFQYVEVTGKCLASAPDGTATPH